MLSLITCAKYIRFYITLVVRYMIWYISLEYGTYAILFQYKKRNAYKRVPKMIDKGAKEKYIIYTI